MEVFILWIGMSLLVGVVGKDRNIGFGMAFFWALLLSPIIGIVIALLSDKRQNSVNLHKYKFYLEEAKKAEFKGTVEIAIDNYMDALYHLENDYKVLSKGGEKKRQEIIIEIRNKVGILKK